MTIKAITLWQPWATLVAFGLKTIETRRWGTEYRGPLAIHAARAISEAGLALLHQDERTRELMAAAGYASLEAMPRGCVVATGELLAVVRLGMFNPTWIETALPREAAWGDFRSGRYAWRLGEMRRLPEPIGVRGERGLWDWTRP